MTAPANSQRNCIGNFLLEACSAVNFGAPPDISIVCSIISCVIDLVWDLVLRGGSSSWDITFPPGGMGVGISLKSMPIGVISPL